MRFYIGHFDAVQFNLIPILVFHVKGSARAYLQHNALSPLLADGFEYFTINCYNIFIRNVDLATTISGTSTPCSLYRFASKFCEDNND